MAEYIYDEDGKVHTRYSELVRCTAGQIDRVLAERFDGFDSFHNEATDFGTDRHEMWAKEAEETGFTAACFPLKFRAEHVEKEFKTEIFKNVIAHSRPDVISETSCAVIDYKTLCADSLEHGIITAHNVYERSRQGLFYAFQLSIHNVKINKIIYLVEIWNRERDEILGYEVVQKDVKMSDIMKVIPWVKDRVSMLCAALDERATV